MMDKKKLSLVIISAPSGCGKDTVIEGVLKRLDNIGVSVSCTTRGPRKKPGGFEVEGKDYFFIERPEFEKRIGEGGFLEYATFNGELYGTPRAYVDKLSAEGNDVVILNIENQGAAQVKALDPTAISIFLLPPDAATLYQRLLGRGSEEKPNADRRMAEGKAQMRMAYVYDYVVMNDDVEKAISEVVQIISAARCRTTLHKELIDRINATFD